MNTTNEINQETEESIGKTLLKILKYLAIAALVIILLVVAYHVVKQLFVVFILLIGWLGPVRRRW